MNSSSNQNQTSRAKALVPALLITALLALAGAALVRADLAANNLKTPSVFPPNATPFGKTYAQWSEAWWQWCFSLPITANPLFDTADCSAAQAGSVWFLGGNFTGTPVTRNCTVPTGTALFFPILNNEADNTDCSNGQMISDNLTEDFFRGFLRANMDRAENLSCIIDGVAVAGLTDPITTPYRVPSPTPGGFSYTLPSTDNLLNFYGFACWTDNTGTPIPVDAAVYHPVADGVYIMVKPLAPGNHTIHFGGNAGTFVEDVTYHITVTE